MLKRIAPISVVGAVAIAATAFAVSVSSSGERLDCPGKIVCPLTGELVCEDRRPVDEQIEPEQIEELPACCRASE